MMTVNAKQSTAMRGHLFLRWMRGVFVFTGALAITYVALTLIHAKLFQNAANNTLEEQIFAQKQQEVNVSAAVAKHGGVLGRIEITRLGMVTAILEGTAAQSLRLGVGHIEGTALPGEPGNAGIAGHRDTFFRALKDIRVNDEIQIQTATGLFRYQVDWVRIVAPDDTGILAPSMRSSLTLITCYPFHLIGPAPKRFAVHAYKEQ